MAKFPIVVVKENPGTQVEPGKLVVAVQLSEEKQVELKFPWIVGALRPTATLNGQTIEATDGAYKLQLGEDDYPAE
ncbi:MAG: hypothetical protein ACREK2_06425 [Gemmatimonadota bacterium]